MLLTLLLLVYHMELNRSNSIFEEIDLEILEDLQGNQDLLFESIILFIMSSKCQTINISFFISDIIEKIIDENCKLIKSGNTDKAFGYIHIVSAVFDHTKN